jgi:hypothetical protein
VWWIYIVMPALLAVAVYGVILMTRGQVRALSRKSTRTAEDLYEDYADTPRQQRRYAKQHGGTWRPG